MKKILISFLRKQIKSQKIIFMDADEIYELLNKIIGIYSVFLAIFGTIGNLISFSVCIRKKLRKTPAFVFMAIMNLFESLSLYFWNMNSFYIAFIFSMPIGDVNRIACKLTTFFQYFSSTVSAYLLVIVIQLKVK